MKQHPERIHDTCVLKCIDAFVDFSGKSVLRDCGLGRISSERIRDERGQAVVLVALCMTVLMGFLGFAVDVGLLFIEKRKVQEAADIAAVAGAAELNYGDWTAAAQAAAAQNGFTNGVNGVTVTVNPSGTGIPSPLYGAYVGKAGYLEVIVSESVPTLFMKMLKFGSVTVNARGVGALGSSQNCVYALAGSGTTINMSNSASLTAPGCGVIDDSSSSSAISVVGSATLSAGSVGSVGGSVSNNNGTISPSAVSGIAPISDPLAFLAPPTYNASSCGADPLSHYGNGGSSYSVGPGSTYSTTQSGNLVCYTSLNLGVNADTVTLNPGIYVITGAMTVASGQLLGGNGVTFYLVGSGSLSIANGANFNLTAPTSGTYDGILFYQDRSDTTAASIQGGASENLTGILYFPDAALTIGNGTSSTFTTPIVASTITIVGGSSFQDNDYASVNSSTPLTSPRLVE
jgi:Flp pilus assembly protein TadG